MHRNVSQPSERHNRQTDQRTALLRPPDRTPRQKFADFFWDNRTKTCLTRTPVNWLSISLYYSLFLVGVILIFYISMLIAEAVASRDAKRPQYLLGDSMIGDPCLNFFPLKEKRNLIWLGGETNYWTYVNLINDEFKKYKKIKKSFNTTQFADCGKSPFGYGAGTPCIFLRLNRILSWKPKPYEKDDDLPEDMPKKIKDLVEKTPDPKIWISCVGTTGKDRDHIPQDSFKVQGIGGLDIAPFPFNNQEGFIDPIVAIKVVDSRKDKKILLSFTCTPWAKNIDTKKAEVDVSYYLE